MAKRISQLTALTTAPARDDIFVMVDDPAGSPITKKVAYSNLFPAFNVKSYGAVGDNVTDDTAAIQAAANAAGGSVLYVPKGDYKITGEITISSTMIIRGDGYWGGSTISMTNAGRGFVADDVTVLFEGLRIFNAGGTTNGIYAPDSGVGVGAVYIRDCKVHAFTDDGIFIGTEHGGTQIESCIVEANGGSGIRNRTFDAWIDRCSIGDNVEDGIETSNSAVKVTGCSIYRNTKRGIYAFSNCRQLIVSGNQIDKNGEQGIYFDHDAVAVPGYHSNVIANNILTANSQTTNLGFAHIKLEDTLNTIVCGNSNGLTSVSFPDIASYMVEVSGVTAGVQAFGNEIDSTSTNAFTNDSTKFAYLQQETSIRLAATQKVVISASGLVDVYALNADANPLIRMGQTGIEMGPGGATAMNWRLNWESTDTAVLASGDKLFSTGSVATDVGFGGRVSGDAVNRWVLLNSGRLELGDGTATRDFGMGRTVANRLDIDSGDSLYLTNGNLTLAGSGNTIDFSHSGGGLLEASDTTTGLKILSAATKKLGFYGATPVVRPSAYTQTYSTADKTLNAYTSDPESSAYTGIDNLQGGTPYAQAADLNALRVAYENLRAFTEDAVQMLNSLVDDQQSLGLVG